MNKPQLNVGAWDGWMKRVFMERIGELVSIYRWTGLVEQEAGVVYQPNGIIGLVGWGTIVMKVVLFYFVLLSVSFSTK